MKAIIGYAVEDLNLPPITTQQLKKFNNQIGRIPSQGEMIRFGGRDHEILTVITDLDTGMIRIGISPPVQPRPVIWCQFGRCVRDQVCGSRAGTPGYPKTCAGVTE